MLDRAADKLERAGIPPVLAEADATRMPLSRLQYGTSLPSPSGSATLPITAVARKSLRGCWHREAAWQCWSSRSLGLGSGGGCSTSISGTCCRALAMPSRVVAGLIPICKTPYSDFRRPEQVRELFLQAGFERVEIRPLSGGVAVLYLAYT